MKKGIIVAALVLVALVALAACGSSEKSTEVIPNPGPAIKKAKTAAKATEEATKAHAGVKEGYTYTCSMHPDVKSDKPGKCPECGMFLEADTQDAVEYVCPMHAEQKSDSPGKCAECGMFFEARQKQPE